MWVNLVIADVIIVILWALAGGLMSMDSDFGWRQVIWLTAIMGTLLVLVDLGIIFHW